ERNAEHPAPCRGKRVYVFSGLLRCGRCGKAMTGNGCGGGKEGSNTYRCRSKKESGRNVCSAGDLSEPRLRDRLAEHLVARFTDAFMDAFDEAYRRDAKAQAGPDPVELERAKARLEELKAEAEEVYRNVRRARDEQLFAQLQEDYAD